MESPRPDAVASLSALSRIALAINTLEDPDVLIERILTIAMETLDAERGLVLLAAPEAPRGFDVRHRHHFRPEADDEIDRISNGVVREVMQSGEPVLLYHALDDARYGANESIVLEQIQSIACVPLRLKRRQIGAIYLDSLTRRGRFTPEHLPFLEAFANQAAVALENARLYQSLRDENRQLRTEMQRLHGFDEIIGQSARMRDVFDLMSRVLDTDASILITGESGTGKELVARALHYNGRRKDHPFVAVFCGSLPDELLESELFGHARGAFTGAAREKKGLFEVADGGTIFLDEVGDLSPRMQTALLRVLQEGEIKRVGETHMRRVDVRVISATHRRLDEMIEAGDFREDLYYRLDTITLDLPPLRHRRADIPLLAHHFLDRYTGRTGRDVRGIAPEALASLQAHRWPGNVRELENTIERAVVLARGDHLQPDDLRLPRPDPEAAAAASASGLTLKEVERHTVERTLADLDGNISETARTLGVSRRWLHYRLKEWSEDA